MPSNGLSGVPFARDSGYHRLALLPELDPHRTIEEKYHAD